MCHTILHRNNDDKSCLEVAFTSPLEISRVLFVVRFLVGWFGFFFGGWRLVCLTFFNRGCYNDSAPVSSMVCKQLNQYWLVTVVGRGLCQKQGLPFPNQCHVTPSEAPSFWLPSCFIFDKVLTQSFVWPRLGGKKPNQPQTMWSFLLFARHCHFNRRFMFYTFSGKLQGQREELE